jgi:phosphatidylglycerophosphate synthase
MPIHDAAGLARAERALHLVLRSESDSRLDRVLHRPCSRWLTRLLSATPATPNQVTLASLLIGALAIWCFWHATPSTVLWGILLYWLANVLDHSDGELARLTFQESAFGARLDWAVDTVVHTGVALAIAVTGRCTILVATLAAAGIAFSAWFAPRANRKIETAGLGRAFGALGTRDPFYAVLGAFALLVWFRPALVSTLALLVAVGSHAYWIGAAAQRLRTLQRSNFSTAHSR